VFDTANAATAWSLRLLAKLAVDSRHARRHYGLNQRNEQ